MRLIASSRTSPSLKLAPVELHVAFPVEHIVQSLAVSELHDTLTLANVVNIGVGHLASRAEEVLQFLEKDGGSVGQSLGRTVGRNAERTCHDELDATFSTMTRYFDLAAGRRSGLRPPAPPP